jgi:hypothetical protein
MPSWKKVILSGSNAALNTLTVSNGITGSLSGSALSASYAPNIYNSDGVLTSTRTLDVDGNQFIIDAQTGDMNFQSNPGVSFTITGLPTGPAPRLIFQDSSSGQLYSAATSSFTASYANTAGTASYLSSFPTNPYLAATQNNTLSVASANTAYSMSFDTLDMSDQISLVSSSRLSIDTAGKYTIQFSANIQQTSATSPTEVYIWLSREGTDLTSTNRQITMDGAGSNFTVASWNWVVDAPESSYYEIRYGASNTNIEFTYQPTPSIGPEIPAALVSVFRID